jgi:hypothetical protein
MTPRIESYFDRTESSPIGDFNVRDESCIDCSCCLGERVLSPILDPRKRESWGGNLGEAEPLGDKIDP